jgi:hypothetical protein
MGGLVILWILAVLPPTRAAGQPVENAPEYGIKAAFLLNFARFVEWPAEALAGTREPLRLGIVGTDPFGDMIDRVVQGSTIRDRPVVVHRLTELSEIDDCHILFISESETQRLREVFERSEGKPILTVGESRRFLDSGGMIRFKVVGRRVRFEIDQSAAKQAGLEVSSKLMNLSARGSGP